MTRFSLSIFLGLALSAIQSPLPAQSNGAQTNANTQEVLRNWSLFSEYQKNGDFQTAIPYGWNVYRLDPKKLKTLYTRMAECYFGLYEKDSLDARVAYADTMIMLYDLGIKHIPDRTASFWLSKAYALENYFDGNRNEQAIEAYEKVVELDFDNTDFAYLDRLGVLYIRNSGESPAFKQKAIALYRRSLEKDSNNETAGDRLKRLISDPKELIEIAEGQLATDPQNPEKIWNAAQAYIDAEHFDGAEKYLQNLVKKAPKTPNYWNELAKVQQRQRKFRQAIDSYEKALGLNVALRENYLNITVCYRELKNYSAARSYALRAVQKEKGWGRPYVEIAEVYKASVEECIRDSRGGDWARMDFNDKLVYKLAADSYMRAKSVESILANEVDQRVRELSTLVPAREDYFFHRDRIQNGKIDIQSSCYTWINEPVSVPSLK
jgi:tetratricopeptide (TPR) repeat protein